MVSTSQPRMRPFRGYVVVSGAPATGKSTLAAQLGDELSLPVLAKDVVKDALVECLGADSVERSREIGAMAVRVLVAVAGSIGYGIIESVWHRYGVELLQGLPGSIVEVHCRCDAVQLRERYRARSVGRGAGYFDAQRDPAELWNDEVSSPVAGGWPVIDVDTGRDVDVRALADDVAGARHRSIM